MVTPGDKPVIVRRAVASDREAYVALRASMFEAMGVPDWDDAAWKDAAREWYDREWRSPEIHLVVVEVSGSVVASAMATLTHGSPAPGNLSGTRVMIQNVSTLAAARGNGYAQLAFDEVMRWVREESGAEGADLFATDSGRGMYERVGFRDSHFPALRMTLPKHPSAH